MATMSASIPFALEPGVSTFRLSPYMIAAAPATLPMVTTSPGGVRAPAPPAPAPRLPTYMPAPEPSDQGPPLALIIAGGVAAAAVVGLIAYKKLKKR
jgi:hypothetical protein